MASERSSRWACRVLCAPENFRARRLLRQTSSISMTAAEREGELAQLNGKLFTVAKAQFAKSCPAYASPSSVVR